MQPTDLESAVGRQSWEWLVDLAPRLDIVVEMVDADGVPVFPVGSAPDAASFRQMLKSGAPSLRSAMTDVAGSRRSISLSIENVQAVCCGMTTGGALFVARRVTGADPSNECRQDLESIGNWLTGAIEASLAQTSGISVEPYRIVSLRRMLHEATSRGSIRTIIGAFVEALSVWDDVRVRCYLAGATGGFVHYGSPLATLPSMPDQLDEAVVPPHTRLTRLSDADVDRLGLASEPGDTLLLRILVGDIAWLIIFSGTIDDSERVRLTLYSDMLRESLSDVVTMATSRLVAEMSPPHRPMNESPETAAQTALDQMTSAIGAQRGALAVATVDGRQELEAGHKELLMSLDEPHRSRMDVKASDADSVIRVVFEREQEPFTALDRELALVGMAMAHRWIQGGRQRLDGMDGMERRRRFQPVDAVFDQLAIDTVATGQDASVIVVSADAVARQPGLLAAWVGRIRANLRAGDFAGILSESEIAVLLCGASADHAAVVTSRLTQLFKSHDSSGAFLHSAIGMTTRSPDSSFEGSIVGAARALAASHR